MKREGVCIDGPHVGPIAGASIESWMCGWGSSVSQPPRFPRNELGHGLATTSCGLATGLSQDSPEDLPRIGCHATDLPAARGGLATGFPQDLPQYFPLPQACHKTCHRSWGGRGSMRRTLARKGALRARSRAQVCVFCASVLAAEPTLEDPICQFPSGPCKGGYLAQVGAKVQSRASSALVRTPVRLIELWAGHARPPCTTYCMDAPELPHWAPNRNRADIALEITPSLLETATPKWPKPSNAWTIRLTRWSKQAWPWSHPLGNHAGALARIWSNSPAPQDVFART